MSQNHQSKEFKAFRGFILILYQKKCFFCHKIDSSNHVHHLDSNSANNSIYNLIVLCPECHQLTGYTANKIKISNASLLLAFLRLLKPMV